MTTVEKTITIINSLIEQTISKIRELEDQGPDTNTTTRECIAKQGMTTEALLIKTKCMIDQEILSRITSREVNTDILNMTDTMIEDLNTIKATKLATGRANTSLIVLNMRKTTTRTAKPINQESNSNNSTMERFKDTVTEDHLRTKDTTDQEHTALFQGMEMIL